MNMKILVKHRNELVKNAFENKNRKGKTLKKDYKKK